VLAGGTRIGPYEIVSSLGAGGMGEVYRAHDTQLGRDVALKILPDAFASDSERLARFEREARTLAALNHPHIAHLYGIEARALVMELVEGEDLAQRIARGPIPLDEAVPIARQIAEALEAAHDAGIIHRDLKPANIKVRDDGSVKVLDFGLAKAFDPVAAGAAHPAAQDLMNSPTITSPAAMTMRGMILGTAAYMSPEQAKGKAVDKRADIWAFGVVVHEMLTGRSLFSGETASETLAAVIRADLDLTALPAATPSSIRQLLGRCLERDPRARLRDIGEARILLERPVDAPVPSADSRSGRRQPALRGILPWAVSGALAIALVLALLALFRRTPTEARRVWSSIALPPGASFHLSGGNPGPIAVSPDGTRLVFTVSEQGKTSLWVRDLDANNFRPIPGTEGAQYPFWSPDSRSIGFFSVDALKTVSLSGGLPVTVADAADGGKGGAWSANGTIVFTPGSSRGIARVSSGGGSVTFLTKLPEDRRENSHRFPALLPDGKHFVFLARAATDTDAARRDGAIHVGSVEGAVDRVLAPAESHAVFAAGHLLFVQPRTSTLVARPFDPATLAWRGDPITIAEDVLVLGGGMRGVFDVSQNGVLAYVSERARPVQELAWFTRTGTREHALMEIGDYQFRLSPDGDRVVFEDTGGGGAEDLWIVETRRGVRTRLTRSPQAEQSAVWSPDGHSVIFGSAPRGPTDIYWKSPARGDDEVVLFADKRSKQVTDWSRDGRFVLFHVQGNAAESGIWVLPLSASIPPQAGTPTRLVESHGELGSAFSPDGHWVAFGSIDPGTPEVFITRFPEGGSRRQVSNKGGAHPRWRADGRELYYVTQTGGVMAVGVQARADGDLEIGTPTLLFETGRPLDAYATFDVTADGQRFLALSPRQQSGVAMMTLITNWTQALTKGR
jgi:serine/threonine protein kinase